MIPLINHDSQWGRSEVVIIYPDTWTIFYFRFAECIPSCFVFLKSNWTIRSNAITDPSQQHPSDDVPAIKPTFGWIRISYIYICTGWWYTYPSEKYESQLGLLFPIYGKQKMIQTTNQICIYIYTSIVDQHMLVDSHFVKPKNMSLPCCQDSLDDSYLICPG